jgi:hypothetical protein
MPPDDLTDLRESLLRNLRRSLGPDDGDEAFECHIRLAVRIHRAARLNARRSDGEGDGWRRYFVDYFPEGRNSFDDAHFLWRFWRTRLLKDEAPVAISHGQSGGHWLPVRGGGFCVNLESMWDDFEYSVHRFIEALQADERRRRRVLRLWRERSWTVEPIPLVPHENLFPSPMLFPGAISASVTATAAVSATAVPPSWLPKPPT